MTQLSITFDDKLVRQGLQDLAAEIPKIGRLQIYQTEQAVVRREKDYWFGTGFPPQLPSYQRTGRLAMGWQITALPNGYMVSNSVPYTQYVVGNAYGLGQAWMHQPIARWGSLLLRDVQEEENLRLGERINDEINIVARRDGL